MTRGEANSIRTNIKKSAITKQAIREANKILGRSGFRLCKYSGELLELNDKNFHKSASDAQGYQPISKFGKKLYHADLLEVKKQDRTYSRYDGISVTTA